MLTFLPFTATPVCVWLFSVFTPTFALKPAFATLAPIFTPVATVAATLCTALLPAVILTRLPESCAFSTACTFVPCKFNTPCVCTFTFLPAMVFVTAWLWLPFLPFAERLKSIDGTAAPADGTTIAPTPTFASKPPPDWVLLLVAWLN